MFTDKVIEVILTGIKDTLYMTLVSTVFGYVLGLPLGVILNVTRKDGLRPNSAIYGIIGFICNIIRSIPFLILLILLIPFTRFLVGQSYGSSATIVPLVICAAPYIARVVESSLNEVDAAICRSFSKCCSPKQESLCLPEPRSQLACCSDIRQCPEP